MVDTGKPMSGKICVVTGATSGIGEVTARELARQGATVIVVGRSQEKSAATVEKIEQETGNANVEYMLADLAVQQDVRGLAEQVEGRHQRLHVLVNNAGAVILKRQQTVDGIETTFALNHLSYFLLTNLLLDRLKAGAPARIVNVSSNAHERGKLDFDDLQGASGFGAYARSKLANVMFTYELARRLEGTGVTANVLHPGLVATNFGTNNGLVGRLLRPLFDRRAISPEEGARTSIYLASSPEVEGVTGRYFVKETETRSAPRSYDERAQARLWEASAELTHSKNA